MRIEMRINWAKMAVMVVLAGIVVAPMSIAMAQQGSDVKVDLNLKDADMMSATNVLFERTGIQFVVEPSSNPYKRVTLKLDSVTAEEAVRYICQAAGAFFRRDENGVFIISHDKPVVEPTLPLVPSKNPKVVRKMKVLKAGARDVYDQIVLSMPMDVTRGMKALDQFAKLGQPAEMERLYGKDFNPKAIQPEFGPVQASPAPTQLNRESGSDVTLPFNGESSSQLGGGGGFGQGGGGNGGGLGGGGLGGGGLGGGGQQGGGGGSRLTGGTGLVGDSIDFISYDPTDNSLVVRGNEDDINQLQTYINLFDVAPRQVEIKVEFITTTDTLSKDFGADFLYARGTQFLGTAPGTFAATADPVFINYASGNVTGRLRTSLKEGNAKVVSAPIIRTLNNQPASIFSSITSYAWVPNTIVSNGSSFVNYSIVQIGATTSLSVAPRINDDQTITVYLVPQVQTQIGTSIGPDGSTIPNISTQAVRVVARVRNNETIVLGGLNTKSESENINKVPVLADLPIIGQFFRSNAKTKGNSELLIFVTPSIIDEDSTTGPGGP